MYERKIQLYGFVCGILNFMVFPFHCHATYFLSSLNYLLYYSRSVTFSKRQKWLKKESWKLLLSIVSAWIKLFCTLNLNAWKLMKFSWNGRQILQKENMVCYNSVTNIYLPNYLLTLICLLYFSFLFSWFHRMLQVIHKKEGGGGESV